MPKEIKEKPEYKTFSDTVGARAFPDAKEAELKSVIGVPIIIKDLAIKAMKFGDVAILLFTTMEDTKTDFTVLAGGVVIRKKCQEAKDKRLLPLVGTIVYDGKYYDIV